MYPGQPIQIADPGKPIQIVNFGTPVDRSGSKIQERFLTELSIR